MPNRTLIDGHLDVETPDGHAFRIHVIEGGEGLGIVPIAKRTSRPAIKPRREGRAPGREPGPGTVAVRRQMASDAASGALQASAVYAALLRSVEPSATEAGANQRVYREKRKLLTEQPGLKKRQRTAKAARAGAGKRPGRKSAASTIALRQRLALDAERGGVEAARAYADFLVQRGVRERTALQTAYRERRAFLGANAGAKVAKATREARSTGRSKRGRSDVLEPLRAKLRADADTGDLRATRHYIQWVLEHDKKIGLKRAKTMVYRERRAVSS